MSKIDDIWEAYYKGQAAAENDDVLSMGVHQTFGHIADAMLPGGDSDEEIAFEKGYHGDDLEICDDCEHVQENCECAEHEEAEVILKADARSSDDIGGSESYSGDAAETAGGRNDYSGGDSSYSGGFDGDSSYSGGGWYSSVSTGSQTDIVVGSRVPWAKVFVYILISASILIAGVIVSQRLLPRSVETAKSIRSSIEQKSQQEWQVTLYGDDGWYDTGVSLKKGQWVHVVFATSHAPGFYENMRMQLNGTESTCVGSREVKFDQTLKLRLLGDGSQLLFGGFWGNYVVADIKILSRPGGSR